MSDTSGPMFCEPFAFFDPDSSSLRTCQATLPLGLTESSPTLPASGWMRDGLLYEHQMSAHLTGELDSSSLPTPTAHPRTHTPRQVHHGAQLANEVSLPPTPRAQMGESRNSNAWVREGGPQNLKNAIGEVALPPTLTAASTHAETEWTGVLASGSKQQLNLATAVNALLPTPTANQPGGTVEQHLARKARMPGGPRTTVTDLRMAVELLPTPTRRDCKGQNQRNDATCLPGAIALLPTPTARLGMPRGAQAARYTNPERSVDLDDAIAWMTEPTGSDSGLPSDGGNASSGDQPLRLW